jgi:hypothetical protein
MDLSGITRPGVVLPTRVDARGLDGPTKREAAGPGWRSPYRCWHVPSDVDSTDADQRIVEAAAILPAGGAITGWAGLHWAGGRYFDGPSHGGTEPLPVTLALDNKRTLRAQPGIELCEEYVRPDEIIEVDGLPVTNHARSVCRLLRTTRSLEQRVQILDMAAFDDLCSPGEVEAYARAHLRGRPHVTRIWQAVPWAVENSWSPMEPVMRLTWLASRRVILFPNAPIFDLTGRHIITPDLLDPVSRVAGEYNGAPHRGIEPRERDLDREEVYRSLGIEVVTMMGADRDARDGFVRRLASAYQRAAARPRTDGWTLTPPEWWRDTSTVAARRALTAAERGTLLRHRRAA